MFDIILQFSEVTMFKKMKIGSKTIIVISLLIFALVTVITVINSNMLMRYSESRSEELMMNSIRSIDQEFISLGKIAYNEGLLISKNPLLVSAIQSNDREQMIKCIEELIPKFSSKLVTLTDSKGIVVYRQHTPEKWGDDVSNNLDIKSALAGSSVFGVIKGSAVPIAARSAVPIYNQNKNMIAIISIGYRLDAPELLDKYKSIFNLDFTIFKDDLRINTTLKVDGKRAVGTKLKPEIAKIVLQERKNYSGKVDVLGVERLVYYQPILGLDGKVLGILFAGDTDDAAVAQRNESIIFSGVCSLSGIAIISFLLFITINKLVTKPLKQALAAANSIANGKLDVDLESNDADEVGMLLQAMKQMSVSLNELIDDVYCLTNATTSGHLDVRTNANKHNGVYRELLSGINGTLDAVIRPLNVAAEYIDRISKGDIPPKIVDEYNGDFNEIKNNINQCIDAMNHLIFDSRELFTNAIEGKINFRANIDKHHGEYRHIISGVNSTLDRLVGFIDEMPIAMQIVDREQNVIYSNKRRGLKEYIL